MDSNKNNNNKKKKRYDAYGQPVDEYGRPVDKNGIAYADYDEQGNPPRRPQSTVKKVTPYKI